MPVSGLVDVLPSYDIYLTASEEEAGANHVLESLAAGLPIVYRDTGHGCRRIWQNHKEGL